MAKMEMAYEQSPCVSVDLEVYCARHREELHWRNWESPKFACDAPSRGANGIPPDLVERTISYDWQREHGTSVLGFAWVVRATNLISAFVQRHNGCALPLVYDFDNDDVHEAYLAAQYGRYPNGTRRHPTPDGLRPNWREYFLHHDVAMTHIDSQRFDGVPIDSELDALVAPAAFGGDAERRGELLGRYNDALRSIPWGERCRVKGEELARLVDLAHSMVADPFQAP